MLIIHLLIFVIHGYDAGNGVIRKRSSPHKWNAEVEKKSQIPADAEVIQEKDLLNSATGNVQYQQEEQLANGTVVGKYGIMEPNGKLRLVSYTADKDGYRPKHESVSRIDYVAEDTLKNVDPKDLKLHNQLADFNSIKAAIAPSEKLEDPSNNAPEKFFDIEGYASSYRPYSSCCGDGYRGGSDGVYRSKYYSDYYPGNTYFTPSSGSGGGGSFYPDSRSYGVTYPGYVYNSYGPTLPTKYHHTSQLYPAVEPPPIPNYYPLYDIPTRVPPRIPTVNSYPCCSG